jgi:hypothetical protein
MNKRKYLFIAALAALLSQCSRNVIVEPPDRVRIMSITDSLEAYWTMNETSGTRRDTSANSNHLTDNNTVLENQGVRNGSADFEASNSEYLSIADNASLSFGDVDFSIAGWIQFENASGSKTVIGKWDASNLEYIVQHSGTNGLRFFVNDGSSTTNVTNGLGALSVDTWYFFVAQHDATNDSLIIQVNTTRTAIAYSSGVQDAGSDVEIGRESDFTCCFWDGEIDELAVWRKKLTMSEIEFLRNNQRGRSWPLSKWADLYVSTLSGSSSNGGTSWDDALDLTATALTNVQAGDTIVIHAPEGDELGEALSTTIDGTEALPITMIDSLGFVNGWGYTDIDTTFSAIFDGTGTLATGLNLSNEVYYRIIRLQFENYTTSGITFGVSTTNCAIYQSRFIDNTTGVLMTATTAKYDSLIGSIIITTSADNRGINIDVDSTAYIVNNTIVGDFNLESVRIDAGEDNTFVNNLVVQTSSSNFDWCLDWEITPEGTPDYNHNGYYSVAPNGQFAEFVSTTFTSMFVLEDTLNNYDTVNPPGGANSIFADPGIMAPQTTGYIDSSSAVAGKGRLLPYTRQNYPSIGWWQPAPKTIYDPSDIVGLGGWWSPDSISGVSDNSDITTWVAHAYQYIGSGAEVQVGESSATDKPHLQIDEYGSFDFVEFDGTDDDLTGDSAADSASTWDLLHDGSEWTMFFTIVSPHTEDNELWMIFDTGGLSTSNTGLMIGIDERETSQLNNNFLEIQMMRSVAGNPTNQIYTPLFYHNRLNHYVITYDGTNMKAYSDSLLWDNQADQNANDAGTHDHQFTIGARGSSNDTFNFRGFLGDWGYYRRVVDADSLMDWMYRKYDGQSPQRYENVLVQDTFTDTDETELSSHTADVVNAGSSWTQSATGASIRIEHDSPREEAEIRTTGSSLSQYYYHDVNETDSIRMELSMGNVSNAGMVFWGVDDDNYWEVNLSGALNRFEIVSVISNSATVRANTGTTTDPTSSFWEWTRVELFIDGDSLTAIVDGVDTLGYNSSAVSFTKGDRYGISMRATGSPATDFDNFIVWKQQPSAAMSSQNTNILIH